MLYNTKQRKEEEMNLFPIIDRFHFPTIIDAAALSAKVMRTAEDLLASREAAAMTFEERGRKVPAALEESAALFATILAHHAEVRDWAVEQAVANRSARRVAVQYARTRQRQVNGNPRRHVPSYREMAAA